MKPPLLLIISLFVPLVEGTQRDPCDQLFKKERVSRSMYGLPKDPEKSKLKNIYINNSEKDKFILYCYYVERFNDKINVAIVMRPDGSHVVSIKKFPCEGNSLASSTYMFVRDDGTNKILSMGMKAHDEDNNCDVWCRNDICINCSRGKATRNPDVTPKVGMFQWSFTDYAGLTWKSSVCQSVSWNKVVASYISIGDPKFLLLCYENGNAILRSTMGGGSMFLNVNCKEGEFLQTFYMYTYNRDKISSSVMSHRLGGKSQDTWYDGSGTKDGLRRRLFYFKAKSPTKNCYWKQIKTVDLYTCTGLERSQVVTKRATAKTILNNNRLTKVAKYMKIGDASFTLHCFRNENKSGKYVSVVTYSTMDHVVTITSLDCSSKDKLDQLFYISQLPEQKGQHITVVVSSRRYVEDNWCSYSIYQELGYLSDYMKCINYGYTPDITTKWQEVGPSPCGWIKREDILKNKITTLRGEDFCNYWNGDPNFKISCKKKGLSDRISTTIYYQEKHLITLKDWYHGNSGYNMLAKFSIHKSSSGNIIVGFVYGYLDEWCGFDVSKIGSTEDIWVHDQDGQDPMSFWWYKEDSANCDLIKKSDITVNEPFKSYNEEPGDLVNGYFTEYADGYMILNCYKTTNELGQMVYIAVFKSSINGYGITVKGLNCSTVLSLYKTMYVYYKESGKKQILVLGSGIEVDPIFSWRDKSIRWCQYDILLDPLSPTIRVYHKPNVRYQTPKSKWSLISEAPPGMLKKPRQKQSHVNSSERDESSEDTEVRNRFKKDDPDFSAWDAKGFQDEEKECLPQDIHMFGG